MKKQMCEYCFKSDCGGIPRNLLCGCDCHIPPNAERTGDKGRVATCIHSELGVCDTCKSDKKIVIQQAPLSRIIEEMKDKMEKGINQNWYSFKRSPMNNAKDFIASVVEKAFYAGRDDEAIKCDEHCQHAAIKAYDEGLNANWGGDREIQLKNAYEKGFKAGSEEAIEDADKEMDRLVKEARASDETGMSQTTYDAGKHAGKKQSRSEALEECAKSLQEEHDNMRIDNFVRYGLLRGAELIRAKLK